ncbi:TraM recognition domain-containing protein [Sulfurimonas aquatica]|uniref:TraM recognition domain-containing protein n=1 Tax=Sulfurimonas aquatica TaxID=2672570 RepID=A0A975B0Y0_9BACT|nr:TraM recognition domain-containing protein [Sulfurimonas aquatica]QSZ42211.1 TraM recognition domain-containing protein [Sulfurimonas aquatica]
MANMGFIQTREPETCLEDLIMVPETFTHSIAFGQTGCGKTSSFIYPNLKNRLELGHGILVYDYKGKEHFSVKVLAESLGRLDDVVEIGKPWGKSINIIQNMDEDELDKFFSNILSHGKDGKYWENSAKSLGQSVLKVLKSVEDFCIEYESIETDEKERSALKSKISVPTKKTIASLVEICSTFENLCDFINKLEKTQRHMENLIEESLQKNLKETQDIKLLKQKYTRLIREKEKFKTVLEDTQVSLDSFGKDSNENLTQNIMGSLISPLVSLSQNIMFNTNSFDIASALNQGKIIVVNVESMSDVVVESLNNTILYELSKRTNKMNLHPISIFIDEIQRVVSKNSDLPIDVFREAKVDLILATQNSALLKDKLEDEKFEALMGNLTQKYYFKSSSDEEINSINELRVLEGFEYLCSSDDYSKVQCSTPIFITESEKLKIEYKYQKELKVLFHFLYVQQDKPYVLNYDARLFKSKKVIAINIKTFKESIEDSMSHYDYSDLSCEVDFLFKKTMKLMDKYPSVEIDKSSLLLDSMDFEEELRIV